MNIGCSSFTWESKDGSLKFMGRTFDSNPTEMSVTYFPRNFKFEQYILDPDCQSYQTKYAMVGTAAPLPQAMMDDGINEKGLMGSMQLFPPAVYNPMDVQAEIKLNPLLMIGFVLGQCATIEDVKELVPKITVVNQDKDNMIAQVHYMFCDAEGNSLVVEPIDGKLAMWEDNIGVMTNAPEYPWHMTNLRNYLTMTPDSPQPLELCGKTFPRISTAQGFNGLPGGYASTARFVRLAFVKNFLEKGESELDCVSRMFSGFYSVTVPEGMTVASLFSDAAGITELDCTRYTTVMCPQSLTYYTTWWSSKSIEAFKLEDLMKGDERKSFPFPTEMAVTYRA